MRRRSLLWGLVAVAVAGTIFARALNIIPENLYDVILRAWPALLILVGIATFLRNRVPLGGIIALGVSLAIAVNIGALAYSSRSNQQRSDYTQAVTQPLGAGVSLLVVDVATLTTDLDISLAPDETRTVSGEFVGSSESTIHLDYTEDGTGRAVFTLRETQSNAFQRLEAVGRGALRLTLPPDIGIDLVVDGVQGMTTLNLSRVSLERLTVDLERGDVLVNLPAYAPQSPTMQNDPNAETGVITVREGNLTVVIPDAVGASMALNRGSGAFEPIFNETVYNYLRSDVLEHRNFDNASIKVRYTLVVPRGVIRVEDIPGT